MKHFKKIYTQNYSGASKYKWAIKMFVVAICFSLFFGFVSQALLNSMGVIVASLCICVFIFLAVYSDMLGIAVASADIDIFKKWKEQGIKGSEYGLILCENSEKMCCVCADVIGDICSTLCGAGGACIIATITKKLTNMNLILLASIAVSATIAGITIFFKAIMKERALNKSNLIILRLGYVFEMIFSRKKIKKKNKKQKSS